MMIYCKFYSRRYNNLGLVIEYLYLLVLFHSCSLTNRPNTFVSLWSFLKRYFFLRNYSHPYNT